MKLSKRSLVLGLLLSTTISTESFAATLSCWNLFSKRGAKPTLTATIVRDDELEDIVINQEEDGSEFSTSGLTTSAVGKEITTARSPYQGNQELILSKYIRLILPTDLSSANLAKTSFSAGQLSRNLASRQNGVLDVAGAAYSVSQGGNGYTRMHCISR